MPRNPSPERLLLRLVDAAAAAVWAVDGARKLVFFNRACGALLGQGAESLLGAVCNFHPPASPGEAAAALGPPPEAFLGQACRGETTLGGQRRSVQYTPLTAGQGDVTLVLAVVCDAGESLLDLAPLAARLRSLASPPQAEAPAQLLGDSPLAARLRRQVALAQAAAANVLLVGPRGAGLEEVARAIHAGLPVERRGPLIPLDAPLLDAELLQALLTSALRQVQAERSPSDKTRLRATLLVSQVDHLRPAAQTELAGFLALPGLDLQVLATAEQPLVRRAERGKFLPELAYLLSPLTIAAPPLRKRAADLPQLAQHLVQRYNARGGKQLAGLTSDALDTLCGYPWPGDWQEFSAALQSACAAARGHRLGPGDLPAVLRHEAQAAALARPEEPPLKLDEFLAEVERELLARALRKAKGNKSQAAELLGVSRPRLLRRLAQLGLAAPTTAAATDGEDEVVFEPLPDEGETP